MNDNITEEYLNSILYNRTINTQSLYKAIKFGHSKLNIDSEHNNSKILDYIKDNNSNKYQIKLPIDFSIIGDSFSMSNYEYNILYNTYYYNIHDKTSNESLFIKILDGKNKIFYILFDLSIDNIGHVYLNISKQTKFYVPNTIKNIF
jgi:hypothetical protein